jgi:hypothetical protein
VASRQWPEKDHYTLPEFPNFDFWMKFLLTTDHWPLAADY